MHLPRRVGRAHESDGGFRSERALREQNPLHASGPPLPGRQRFHAARLSFDLAAGRESFACPRPPIPTTFPGAMARGDVRIAVTLACEECKRRNYQTEKSKRNNPDRVEFRKYCRWCGKHTPHKETR